MTTTDTTDTGLRGQALAAVVLRRIRRHPGLHDQRSWLRSSAATQHEQDGHQVYDDPLLCKTTACVAGHAIYAAGGYSIVDEIHLRQWYHPSTGQSDVQRIAAHLLQLTPDEATWLFLFTHNEEAREALEELADTGRLDNIRARLDWEYEEN